MAGKTHDHAHIAGQLSFGDELPHAEPPVESDVHEPLALDAEPDAADADIITGPNTRIRAGNAMHRAREGAIAGAIAAITQRGLRGLTMVEAADRGGLARATLYNHVRDKEQLLELVLDHETRRLARDFVAAANLEAALTATAAAIAEHPAVVGVRTHDPAALVGLAGVTDQHVRRLTADALRARGCKANEAQVDLLLRWLGSFLAVPADASTRGAQAAAMARTLG